MPFSTDIDGTVTQGETKELAVSPEREDGTFFVPDSLTATIRFSDGTTTSKSLADFQRPRGARAFASECGSVLDPTGQGKGGAGFGF